MTAEFDLGDNYSIDEDSNGDLVIRDGNGNTVLKHNNGTGKLTAPSQTVNSASDVAVKDYVDSVAQGLDWQDSVIDEQNDPPSSPNTGDRYLIDDNPTGDWSGEPNEIAEWDGSQWVIFDPNDGWAVFLEDVDLLKVYDSGQADWIAFGSAIDHGALAGLGDDDHTQYLLVDGSRNMSGSLDMGSNAITNASSVNTDTELTIPVYSDNANAVQANRSVWYNDGGGPQSSGYYGFDSGVVGPFGTSQAAAEGLTAGPDWRWQKWYDVGPSTDLGAWTRDPDNPLIQEGGSGDWDERILNGCDIIKEGDTYYLFYGARDGDITQGIGYATSTDLNNWTKYGSNPVLDHSSSGWDSQRATTPTIAKAGDTYHMIYQGYDGSNYQLGHATSTDLQNWTKDAANPVLSTGAGGSWDDSRVQRPWLFREGDTWYLFYDGYDGNVHRIGYATSQDGLSSWSKAAANPVLDIGAGGSWEESDLNIGSVIRLGNTYYMLYEGSDTNDNFQFGLARSNDLDTWTKDAANPIYTLANADTWEKDRLRFPRIYLDEDTYQLFYIGQDTDNKVYEVGRATIDAKPP